MNPLSLRATNYRTFEALDLDLPAGCLAIVGENGAGKSSIVNVIDLALFGPESRSLAEYLTDDAASPELEIELTFEHAGRLFRVRRGYSAKGRGRTTLDFERSSDTPVRVRVPALAGMAEEGQDDPHGAGTVDRGGYSTAPLPSEWEPLTRESAKETQNAIEAVLGLSRETFRASAFLAQGDGAAFTEAQPRDRKRILADVLGLDTWERLLDSCRTDKRAADREASELAGRIALLSEQDSDPDAAARDRDEVADRVRAVETTASLAEEALRDAAQRVVELEHSQVEFRARHASLLTCEARLAAKQAVLDRAAEAKREAVEVQAELDGAGDPSARLAELEQRRVEMDAARELLREREAEAARLEADAADAHRERDRLIEECEQADQDGHRLEAQRAAISDPATIPHCPTCEQELRGEAHETALRRIGEARSDIEQRVTAYTRRIDELAEKERVWKTAAGRIEFPGVPVADLAALLDQIHGARTAELALGAARERLAMLKRQVAEVTPELTAEVALLAAAVADARAALMEIGEPEPGALESARADSLAAKARVDECARALTESRAALVRAEAALEQAQVFAQELEGTRARHGELLGELDLLALLERAYGRDGIPALIVEASAIPSIETEANRILAELGTSYRVELRTQRELKSGDGLADTLDVVVIADAGERSYETFSGGERTRINLALRIALARLLAHRRGAESKLLCIDEPEFLDEAGTARLADVLRGLEQEFDRIVLVSHVPTLRDAFDQTIEVVKVDERSMVVAA